MVPIHAWEGAFPSGWAGCCHILPSRSSWTPRGFSLLCCLDAPYAPSVNKQDRSQQTQQDTLSSIGTEQSFSITGNQGKRIQPSLCLRITILGHPIDMAVQCTQKKTPVHPQNSSWACLDLKSMDVATAANAIWARIYGKKNKSFFFSPFQLNKHIPVHILTLLQRFGGIRCKWLLMKLKCHVLVLEFRASFPGLDVPG